MLIAASLSLAAFLGLTGLALDQASVERAETALKDRLQAQVLDFMRGSELTVGGTLALPDPLPDPRYLRPGSGLYAAVLGDDFSWESDSALGYSLPWLQDLEARELKFAGPVKTDAGEIYLLSQGIVWEHPRGGEVAFTISVAQERSALLRQVHSFRETLWTWLGGAAVLLLFILAWVLRWSLNPLHDLERELRAIEAGDKGKIDGRYPKEVEGLTLNLNALIQNERDGLDRYRRTLGDLAHSLKTPLAVLQSKVESNATEAELRLEVREQVKRMSDLVQYQLQRAATRGHQTLSAPLNIQPIAEDIVASLEKAYAQKSVNCGFEIHPDARFFGERGDLLELLGNLLENGFKWCTHSVLLSAEPMVKVQSRRAGLRILVEDDGPGIAPEQVPELLKRGVRGDERVQGHGIGLSIVQDIVRAYRGELKVLRSELGGARFELQFPAR